MNLLKTIIIIIMILFSELIKPYSGIMRPVKKWEMEMAVWSVHIKYMRIDKIIIKIKYRSSGNLVSIKILRRPVFSNKKW